METTEHGSGPIHGDGVLFLEGLEQVVSIVFADIFYAEVVNDKGESDVTLRMLPYGGGARDRRISKQGKVYFQPVIGDAAGLFETRHAFAYLHIDPAVRSGEAAQVVLLNDLVREEIQGEFYVLLSRHGVAIVEIFDVQRHKMGIRG